MANQDDQDRKLPASARKLKKAREDGNVPRSRDLGHFAILAGGGLGLAFMTPTLVGWLHRGMARGLSFNATAMREPGAMFTQLSAITQTLLWVVVPLGAGSVVMRSFSYFLTGWAAI